MQTFARDGLTADQVKDLINSDVIEVDFGCELLDADDNFISDISDDLLGGTISHDSFALINRTANLRIERDITWHNQRLKPYVTVSGDNSARFDLGIFLPTTPQRTSADRVVVDVECFDKTSALDVPIGYNYQLLRGASIVDTIESLIEQAGETSYNIDSTLQNVKLPSAVTWLADNRHTYLSVINDLLGTIGYLPLYADNNGVFRSELFTPLNELSSEWTYDELVSIDAKQYTDFFDIPNKFVFINKDPNAADTYTFTNQSEGSTSVDARGRTITRVYRVRAANRVALILQGNRIAERERQKIDFINTAVGFNPLHEHRDVVTLIEDNLGINDKFIVRRWTLNLNGDDMELELVRNG